MATLKVYVDHEAETLNVWFDDPEKEHICEHAGEDLILVKDKDDNLIGFEKLNYQDAEKDKDTEEYEVPA